MRQVVGYVDIKKHKNKKTKTKNKKQNQKKERKKTVIFPSHKNQKWSHVIL